MAEQEGPVDGGRGAGEGRGPGDRRLEACPNQTADPRGLVRVSPSQPRAGTAIPSRQSSTADSRSSETNAPSRAKALPGAIAVGLLWVAYGVKRALGKKPPPPSPKPPRPDTEYFI